MGSNITGDYRRLPVSGQRAAGRDHDAGSTRTEWPCWRSTQSGQGAKVTRHPSLPVIEYWTVSRILLPKSGF